MALSIEIYGMLKYSIQRFFDVLEYLTNHGYSLDFAVLKGIPKFSYS